MNYTPRCWMLKPLGDRHSVITKMLCGRAQTFVQAHSVHPDGIKTNIVRASRGGDPAYAPVLEKVQVIFL